MQRWMMTTGLAGAAVLAALLVPTLHRSVSKPSPTPAPTPPEPPAVTPAVPQGPAGSLTVSARLDQSTLLASDDEDRYLVLTVTAPEPEGERRLPVDVAVVMDTSGSMSGWHKIDYARAAARELAGSLDAGDRFALVSFSDRARTLWPVGSVTSTAPIIQVINGIQEGGGTNMYDGITTGLEQLRQGETNRISRLLLLSDGHANVGISDAGSLASLAAHAAQNGVATSTIGLGLDYNEDLLASMADAGGGSYNFVDRAEQLTEIFGEELSAMTRVVARDTTVELRLSEGVELIDIYGYQDSQRADLHSIYLGDIHAGQSRKIAMRLDVTPASKGTVAIADIAFDYNDLDLGEAVRQRIGLDAPVSTDPLQVSASVDQETAIAAGRARAAELAEEAARAYERDDRQAARRTLDNTSSLLRNLASDLQAPELLEDEASYLQAADAYMHAAPSSEAGRRTLKAQKEYAREYAH